MTCHCECTTECGGPWFPSLTPSAVQWILAAALGIVCIAATAPVARKNSPLFLVPWFASSRFKILVGFLWLTYLHRGLASLPSLVFNDFPSLMAAMERDSLVFVFIIHSVELFLMVSWPEICQRFPPKDNPTYAEWFSLQRILLPNFKF